MICPCTSLQIPVHAAQHSLADSCRAFGFELFDEMVSDDEAQVSLPARVRKSIGDLPELLFPPHDEATKKGRISR
jgi:hypothetical protein